MFVDTFKKNIIERRKTLTTTLIKLNYTNRYIFYLYMEKNFLL